MGSAWENDREGGSGDYNYDGDIDMIICVIVCKQKAAYEMRISDWSSDVCSSDLYNEEEALGKSFAHFVGADGFEQTTAMLNRKDRKSVVLGKSVSVRVDLGGRRIIKKKTSILYESITHTLAHTFFY